MRLEYRPDQLSTISAVFDICPILNMCKGLYDGICKVFMTLKFIEAKAIKKDRYYRLLSKKSGWEIAAVSVPLAGNILALVLFLKKLNEQKEQKIKQIEYKHTSSCTEESNLVQIPPSKPPVTDCGINAVADHLEKAIETDIIGYANAETQDNLKNPSCQTHAETQTAYEDFAQNWENLSGIIQSDTTSVAGSTIEIDGFGAGCNIETSDKEIQAGLALINLVETSAQTDLEINNDKIVSSEDDDSLNLSLSIEKVNRGTDPMNWNTTSAAVQTNQALVQSVTTQYDLNPDLKDQATEPPDLNFSTYLANDRDWLAKAGIEQVSSNPKFAITLLLEAKNKGKAGLEGYLVKAAYRNMSIKEFKNEPWASIITTAEKNGVVLASFLLAEMYLQGSYRIPPNVNLLNMYLYIIKSCEDHNKTDYDFYAESLMRAGTLIMSTNNQLLSGLSLCLKAVKNDKYKYKAIANLTNLATQYDFNQIVKGQVLDSEIYNIIQNPEIKGLFSLHKSPNWHQAIVQSFGNVIKEIGNSNALIWLHIFNYYVKFHFSEDLKLIDHLFEYYDRFNAVYPSDFSFDNSSVIHDFNSQIQNLRLKRNQLSNQSMLNSSHVSILNTTLQNQVLKRTNTQHMGGFNHTNLSNSTAPSKSTAPDTTIRIKHTGASSLPGFGQGSNTK